MIGFREGEGMFRSLLCLSIVFTAAAQSPTRATATLKNAQVHIHNVSTCTAPDFTSAGPHFNPGAKQHGSGNPNGPHAGDLPNFEVDAKGVGDVSFAVPDITLGEGPNSLFHAGGTALVIHAAADDNKTDPSGNAGARIACGVIEKAK